MPRISIRERTSLGSHGENATVSFEDGPFYDVTIQDPFSEQQEQQLEWYFEEHLYYPFKDDVKARQCAQSITAYGERLFEQIFRAHTDVYVEYQKCVRNGLPTVQIEIAGSPSFHHWHWEALKDPTLDCPLVLQVTMVRKNITPQNLNAVLRPSTTINILVVIARPSGEDDMGYRTISRPIVEALRNAQVPVHIDILRPGTYQALFEHLREYKVGYYHVIHFDMHGALLSYEKYHALQDEFFKGNLSYGLSPIEAYEEKKAFLAFEAPENGKEGLVEASALAELLIEYHIPIAILNACQSGKQVGAVDTSLGSRLMTAGVQMVLAMGYSVTVSAACLLMTTLYQHLFEKQDLATAIRYARQELYNQKERQVRFNQTIMLEDWLLPVVYQNQPQSLTVKEMTAEETEMYDHQQAELSHERFPEPTYGFVGRDIDILRIEKGLLTRRNMVLIHAMGGAGKTALLRYLHFWWQTTGLVKQVFSFTYDECAWNRQQILDGIARKLLTPEEYVSFPPLVLDAQQMMIVQKLRAERHLFIMDNLEFMSGEHLAIRHTLPQEERQALQRFLVELVGGKTLVLLGSRSREEWLAEHTFADSIYALSGLDPEDALMLAERILEDGHVTKYRDDPHLQHLLKLLDGFPLALEVILANLVHQTPQQVLEALQAGDVALDKRNTQARTESLLHCIDSSYSNLTAEAQQVLLCLAPFTSVMNVDGLEQYIAQLKEQSSLAALDLEKLPSVVREAQQWGLLTADSDIPQYLHLQPVLPYFLRNRLNSQEYFLTQAGIKTAFRLHYEDIARVLLNLLTSKEAQERLSGQLQTRLEYENLMDALPFTLDARSSTLDIYRTLSNYLDVTQEQQPGLELSEGVLAQLRVYPAELLAGAIGTMFVGVIDDVAERYLLLKQYQKAEQLYQEALAIYQESQDRDGQAKTYHQLGRVAEEQRQWEQAEGYYQEALAIYQESQDGYAQAGTYHQLGRVAQEQGQWEQAERYYQEALAIYQESQDRYGQAGAYHELGIVAQKQGQWEQAERYYQEALAIEQESQDRYRQASTYHQLGMVVEKQGQWEQAERYYQEALEIYQESQDRYSQAGTYNQLGTVAQGQGQWEQAESYHQKALAIQKESQDRYRQAGTYNQLGRVAEVQQQWEQAKLYFLEALGISVAYQDMHNAGIVLGSLALLWQCSGDKQLPDVVAPLIGVTPEEVVEMFRQANEGYPE